MSNSYYNIGGVPATGALQASLDLRAEFSRIQSAFDKLPAPNSASGGGFTGASIASSTLTSCTFVSGTIGTNDLSTSLAAYLSFHTIKPTVNKSTTGIVASTSSMRAFVEDHTQAGAEVDLYTYMAGMGTQVALMFDTNNDIGLGGTLTAALATTATKGFPFIPTCAGAPTGVPSSTWVGKAPMVLDTTNNRIYFYNGGWKYAALT